MHGLGYARIPDQVPSNLGRRDRRLERLPDARPCVSDVLGVVAVQDQGIASEVIPEAVGPTAIRWSDPPGGAIDPGTLLRKDRQDARVVQPQERSGRDVVEAGGKRLGTAKEREHLTVPRTTVFPDQHAGGLCPIRERQSP